jgi:hypothetical protein
LAATVRTCADVIAVAAGERRRTAVNEPRIEPTPHFAAVVAAYHGQPCDPGSAPCLSLATGEGLPGQAERASADESRPQRNASRFRGFRTCAILRADGAEQADKVSQR